MLNPETQHLKMYWMLKAGLAVSLFFCHLYSKGFAVRTPKNTIVLMSKGTGSQVLGSWNKEAREPTGVYIRSGKLLQQLCVTAGCKGTAVLLPYLYMYVLLGMRLG